jgi:hypothetical protein
MVMNPLLPDNCFIPDVEARVMPDGRIYLYGSLDVSRRADYCGHAQYLFSSDDMENWVDHGVIFRNDEDFTGIPWSPKSPLYAPDAIEKNGKYYLYVCGSRNEEGVAVGDNPWGPFKPAERIEIADGDGIDPAVFVDEDGQGYLFWGQFSLRGAKLSDDMKTIIPQTLTKDIITEWEHGFHEGASIRRRGDKYYMVYTDISRGRATCMSYAMADSPLGPYKKCGVIIDNTYCDPETWNNHGSIQEFKGQWYVFYHCSSQNKGTCRRVCVEPIYFDENGFIKEVEQTSQGASKPIIAHKPIPARCACRLMQHAYIELQDEKEVVVSTGGNHWGQKEWAEYKYIDFGEGISSFTACVSGKGRITVVCEDNTFISSVEFDTKEYTRVTAQAESTTGVHPIWMFLEGEFTLSEFCFSR